jgi:hypothetical protein
VRHYILSPENMGADPAAPRAANRLGFAVNLAYFRLPGRVLGIEEAACSDWALSSVRSGQISMERAA